MNNQKNSKVRKNIIITAFAIGFFYILLSILNLRCEYLEFNEIGSQYTKVFWTNVKYKYIVAFINFVILFLSLYITNKLICKGLIPFFKDENKEPVRLPNKSISFIISLLSSVIVNYFVGDKVLLWINQTSFELKDPIFNNDIGYFFFQRPFYIFIINYFTYIFAGIIIYTVAYYILAFNMLFKAIDRDILKKFIGFKQIKLNIILIIILQAINVFFKSQDIVYGNFISSSNSLIGAGITNATIKVWTYKILPVLIILCSLLALRFISKQKYRNALISIAVLPVYLIVTYTVCFIFQIIYVRPNELDKEKTYIDYNIRFTRQAYNIDVEYKSLETKVETTSQIIEENEDIIKNVNLTDSSTILKYLNEYQTQKGYYKFNNAYMAKYDIDGEERLVYVSPREINSQDNRTYLNRRYQYTHGYGLCFTYANSILGNGSQDYIIKDTQIDISQPRIYFGQLTNEHVIVNSNKIDEYDEESNYSYNGNAGIAMSDLDRMLMSMKLRRFSNAIFKKYKF